MIVCNPPAFLRVEEEFTVEKLGAQAGMEAFDVAEDVGMIVLMLGYRMVMLPRITPYFPALLSEPMTVSEVSGSKALEAAKSTF